MSSGAQTVRAHGKTQPGASFDILAPIRFETPSRTRFEMWTSVSRLVGGIDGNSPLIHCGGTHRFIARLLGQEILRFFNAADDRQGYAGDTYKAWAAQTHMRSEIWVRPQLAVAGAEFMPNVFPPPRTLPTRTPAQLSKKEQDDRFARLKKNAKRQLSSQGLVFNPQRQSWGKPD